MPIFGIVIVVCVVLALVRIFTLGGGKDSEN